MNLDRNVFVLLSWFELGAKENDDKSNMVPNNDNGLNIPLHQLFLMKPSFLTIVCITAVLVSP